MLAACVLALLMHTGELSAQTARALNLKIPQVVLLRADKVVD